MMIWGVSTDDKIGCDTNLSLGYTYNSSNYDPIYGDAPPSVGLILLKGPSYYTGNSNDTSFYCYGKNRRLKTGYKNTILYSFNRWRDDGPRNYIESYLTMLGLDAYNRTNWINPVTNQPTRYVYSGDPINKRQPD
ncbi:MAG: hypothetical protein L0Y77_12470 [Chlorobi bacterium]|nr:hypothetical protein [Chlorobiota bacterium]